MSDRGQTTLDYAMGMGIFLVAIVGVFAFLPSIFTPLSDGPGTNAIVADRSADQLSDRLLVESVSEPSVLDESCTAAFFDGNTPAACRFDEAGDDLPDALGAGPFTNVNVTIENTNGIRTLSSGGTNVRLAAGPRTPTTGSVVTSRRFVSLAGEKNQLYVSVW
jgi:hypothetical protein